MAAITLQEAFGSNASLTSTSLTIQLSDLASAGLNKPNPSASEILTAIVLRVINSQPSNASEDTERGIVIGTPFMSISRNDSQLERQYPFSIYTPLNITALDPDEVVG